MDGWNGCSEKDDYGEEKLKARHYVAVEQLLPDEILWAQAARTNAVLVILCFVFGHYSTTITSSLLVSMRHQIMVVCFSSGSFLFAVVS